MTAVAGTVVTSELSCVSNGDTAQVSADTQDHQPLRVLHSLIVVLGVSQCGGVDAGLSLNLLSSSVSDEQWLASPLECHIFT